MCRVSLEEQTGPEEGWVLPEADCLEDPREVSSLALHKGFAWGKVGEAGQGVGCGKDMPRVTTGISVLGDRVSYGLRWGQGLEWLTGQRKARTCSVLQPCKGRRVGKAWASQQARGGRRGSQEPEEPTGTQKEKAGREGEIRKQERVKGWPNMSEDSEEKGKAGGTWGGGTTATTLELQGGQARALGCGHSLLS